jgi:two-component system sensor kinase FixL
MISTYRMTDYFMLADISKLQSELNSATEENAELYDFNSTPYLTIDIDLVIVRINFQAAILLGLDRQKILKQSVVNFITFDSKIIFKATMQYLYEKKIKQACDIEILRMNGEKKQALLECSFLKNNLIRLILIDKTETNNLLMRVFHLEKSLNLVSNLFQHSKDAIASLDNQMNITVLNQSFRELFSNVLSVKLDVGTNVGHALFDFLEIKSRLMDACEQSLRGVNSSIILENNPDDAVFYCYEIDISSFYNKYSKKPELILRIKSLTEYKLENKKQHKRQADIAMACKTSTMSEMASAFAHEINQPLTAIMAYSTACLHIIKNNQKNSSELLAPLEQMALQAEHAGKVIHNMKNIMHDGNFHLEKTDINALIKETLSILKYELQDFKFKISLKLMDKPLEIMTNKIHIMQVILNLTRNSIEAMQQVSDRKPELLIESCLHKEHIVVHVVDNGPGIPVKFQDSILNAYFTTKPQGTGIGLGICRSLIEAHGGQLNVRHPEKNGAWFTFTLPIKLKKNA